MTFENIRQDLINFLSGVLVLGVFFLLMLLAVTFIARGVLELTLDQDLKSIRIVRLEIIHAKETHDSGLVSEAVEWNRRITHMQKYNRIWWGDIIIPDAWDDAQPIILPEL